MIRLLFSLLAALPAFPGAHGFGSETVGGSGRNLNPPQTTVFRISSLADAGPGSLRECIDASGPRTCIFETSGVIPITKSLRVLNPYITIAGQTAPVPGITIINGEISVLTHDVVVRDLHIRAGDNPQGTDYASRGTIGFYGDNGGAWNVVADKLSLSWAIDETVDFWYSNVHDITLSNSIVSESLYASLHPQGPQGTASIVGEEATHISYIGNLFAHNFSRNPYFKAGSVTELIDNVIYHWGYGKNGHDGSWAMADLSDYDHTGKCSFHSFVGNVYKCGIDSECNFAPVFSSAGTDAFPPCGRVYVRDNIGPKRTSAAQPEWDITNGLPKATYCTSQPPLSSGTVSLGSEKAYPAALANAGAFAKYRDPIDTRIVQETQAGSGKFINCVASDGSDRCKDNAGGYPQVPEIKIKHELPANPNGLAASGYTNLEVWLDKFPVAPVTPIPTPSPSPSPSPTPPQQVYPPCQ